MTVGCAVPENLSSTWFDHACVERKITSYSQTFVLVFNTKLKSAVLLSGALAIASTDRVFTTKLNSDAPPIDAFYSDHGVDPLSPPTSELFASQLLVGKPSRALGLSPGH